MQSVKQFLSDRVKLVFLHLPLKVGYNSRKFGMTLSGRNYIMCRSILVAASLGEVAGLTPVSVGQVKSKDGLAQMIETMYFVW